MILIDHVEEAEDLADDTCSALCCIEVQSE
jgi:hypothetical protein